MSAETEKTQRRFVARDEFAAMSHTTPDVDLGIFRGDQVAAVDAHPDDPFAR